MVVIAIVGIISGLVVGGLGRSVDRNMKKTAAKLSSTIKYLYNKSAMEGLYARLVFDIEERSYWVEATTDPFVVSMEADELAAAKRSEKSKTEDKNKQKKKESEKKPEEQDEGADKENAAVLDAESKDAEDGGVKQIEPREAKFGQVDSFLLKPSKLPESIFIKDIQVEHRSMPVDSGKESIYFFPNGYVEKAVINLKDDKDELNYSLETNPLSGTVRIEDHYVKIGE